MTICKNCGKPLKWFKDPVNEKWIPLEADCNLEYEIPEDANTEEVLQWKHKCAAVLTCNKGCGTQIYFDPDNRSPSGKNDPDGLTKKSSRNAGNHCFCSRMDSILPAGSLNHAIFGPSAPLEIPLSSVLTSPSL
jgi:hypothetical protein